MKKLLILATILLSFGFANAQCKIYNRAYGGDAIGRFEDGKIYNRAYGGDAIGRIKVIKSIIVHMEVMPLVELKVGGQCAVQQLHIYYCFNTSP